MTSELNPHILRYIHMVESDEFAFCREQKQLVVFIRRILEQEDVYTDDAQLEKYLGLAKYFPYEQVFPWEAFCVEGVDYAMEAVMNRYQKGD